jgi:hypothetical protein
MLDNRILILQQGQPNVTAARSETQALKQRQDLWGNERERSRLGCQSGEALA